MKVQSPESTVQSESLSALTPLPIGIYDRPPRSSGWNFSVRRGPQMGITADDNEDAEAEAKQLGFESFAAMQAAVDHAVLAWIPLFTKLT